MKINPFFLWGVNFIAVETVNLLKDIILFLKNKILIGHEIKLYEINNRNKKIMKLEWENEIS
jgi:hypothetical protein